MSYYTGVIFAGCGAPLVGKYIIREQNWMNMPYPMALYCTGLFMGQTGRNGWNIFRRNCCIEKGVTAVADRIRESESGL